VEIEDRPPEPGHKVKPRLVVLAIIPPTLAADRCGICGSLKNDRCTFCGEGEHFAVASEIWR
jgi:hypothetical protein